MIKKTDNIKKKKQTRQRPKNRQCNDKKTDNTMIKKTYNTMTKKQTIQ
jgi:hypothetical protein